MQALKGSVVWLSYRHIFLSCNKFLLLDRRLKRTHNRLESEKHFIKCVSMITNTVFQKEKPTQAPAAPKKIVKWLIFGHCDSFCLQTAVTAPAAFNRLFALWQRLLSLMTHSQRLCKLSFMRREAWPSACQ